ncbi:unnamed protein product [Durusdinium trenchii]|uniref:FACT complex subunit SSRP1 n=1 Tax=Durusdinium trenchii TaxID=1381693 RepID=A0ABP0Q8L8_9DINO
MAGAVVVTMPFEVVGGSGGGTVALQTPATLDALKGVLDHVAGEKNRVEVKARRFVPLRSCVKETRGSRAAMLPIPSHGLRAKRALEPPSTISTSQAATDDESPVVITVRRGPDDATTFQVSKTTETSRVKQMVQHVAAGKAIKDLPEEEDPDEENEIGSELSDAPEKVTSGQAAAQLGVEEPADDGIAPQCRTIYANPNDAGSTTAAQGAAVRAREREERIANQGRDRMAGAVVVTMPFEVEGGSGGGTVALQTPATMDALKGVLDRVAGEKNRVEVEARRFVPLRFWEAFIRGDENKDVYADGDGGSVYRDAGNRRFRFLREGDSWMPSGDAPDSLPWFACQKGLKFRAMDGAGGGFRLYVKTLTGKTALEPPSTTSASQAATDDEAPVVITVRRGPDDATTFQVSKTTQTSRVKEMVLHVAAGKAIEDLAEEEEPEEEDEVESELFDSSSEDFDMSQDSVDSEEEESSAANDHARGARHKTSWWSKLLRANRNESRDRMAGAVVVTMPFEVEGGSGGGTVALQTPVTMDALKGVLDRVAGEKNRVEVKARRFVPLRFWEAFIRGDENKDVYADGDGSVYRDAGNRRFRFLREGDSWMPSGDAPDSLPWFACQKGLKFRAALEPPSTTSASQAAANDEAPVVITIRRGPDDATTFQVFKTTQTSRVKEMVLHVAAGKAIEDLPEEEKPEGEDKVGSEPDGG